MEDGTEELSFAIVLADLNNLKYVNDTYGHKAGDEYIKRACKLIFDTFAHSPVFRVGGDEFVVVMMGSDYENRVMLMQKIRDQVLENQQLRKGRPIVAVGIATYDRKLDKKVSEVYERADQEMYRNKNHLKNLRAMEDARQGSMQP